MPAKLPGALERFAVDLETLTFGAIENLTLTALVVPYGDWLRSGGGYGTAPYGIQASTVARTYLN